MTNEPSIIVFLRGSAVLVSVMVITEVAENLDLKHGQFISNSEFLSILRAQAFWIQSKVDDKNDRRKNLP